MYYKGILKDKNIYSKCRLAAAEYNHNLSSREKAAMELGCCVASLANYELGIKTPKEHMIIRMADLYNAPELLYHYCANECLLGKNRFVMPEFNDFDRITIKLVNALKDTGDISELIMNIADDGTISSSEQDKLKMVTKALDNISRAAMALQLFVAKNAVKNVRDQKK